MNPRPRRAGNSVKKAIAIILIRNSLKIKLILQINSDIRNIIATLPDSPAIFYHSVPPLFLQTHPVLTGFDKLNNGWTAQKKLPAKIVKNQIL